MAKDVHGVNTTCSPKKRKTCMKLIYIPMLLLWLFIILGVVLKVDTFIGAAVVPGLCMGFYQFYVGKIGKGILYTITFGLVTIGALVDLFKLAATRTFRDANGYPLLY